MTNPKPLTVLVTGAASGIGKACARQLYEAGAEVGALDIQADGLRAALSGDAARLERITADVSRAGDCEAAVQTCVARFGKLDAVVHWAAMHSTLPWADVTAAEFTRTLEVNVTGSFLIAQAAARHMMTRKSGAIVLASSTSMIVGAMGGAGGGGGPAYVASKAAILGLVRSLARALGPSGIRVNAVAPGQTDTPMTAGYSPEYRAASVARVPLGRLGQPEEIASVGAFLISDAARFITGETIIVNGGAHFG